MKKKAEQSGKSLSEQFREWGKKGSKVTTGGFQNMTPKKHKKASAKGGASRRER